jgi:uncharacterized protein YdhG (YjbR/CyaY superfamily)
MRGVTADTIDEYLAALSADQRATLQKLRKAIHAVVPDAEECISYQLPAFRWRGRMLVAFGAAANHCSFYPGAYPLVACKADIRGYDTSKGTLRFPIDAPLPTVLVRKLVKARMDEATAQEASKASKAAARRKSPSRSAKSKSSPTRRARAKPKAAPRRKARRT